MTQLMRVHPTDIVTRDKQPRNAANRNCEDAMEPGVLLVGVKPRDLPALVELLDPDAALNSVGTLAEIEASVRRGSKDVVVTPLDAGPFDAVEVASVLAKRGFKGVLQVLASPLPRPEIVRRELKQVIPNADVDLVVPEASWRTLA